MPPHRGPLPPYAHAVDDDHGLRTFLARVYLKMAAGLVLSAAVAGAIFLSPPIRDVLLGFSPGGDVALTWAGMTLVFAPLLMLVAINFLVRDPTGNGAGPLFWCIAALVGGSMSLLAIISTGAALISTFLVTAGAFAGLSLWGYITHQNLRGVGSFLPLALSGLIIALLASIILQTPAVNLALNALGVLIFSALIASDTQRLKDVYYESTDPEVLDAISNYGALSLYLNLVNLPQLLLSFLAGRPRR